MMSGGKNIKLEAVRVHQEPVVSVLISGVLLNLYHGLDLRFEIFNNGVEYLTECHVILNIYYCQCYQ